MTRMDTLKKKAIQARGDTPSFSRAVAAYFDMVKYVYNDGRRDIDDPPQPMPEIDTPDFWTLFDQLDLDCSRENMRAWIDFAPVEDHILPRRDDSLVNGEEKIRVARGPSSQADKGRLL